MKKFLTISLMILAMFFFVSCAEDDEDFTDTGDNSQGENGNDNNSGDTGNNNDQTDTTDTGSHNDPADSGDTGNNNDPADSGDTGNDPIPPQQECTGISVEWDTLYMDEDYSNSFYADASFGDASLSDFIALEFYQNDDFTTTAGTFNLGTGSNTNYKTCSECVRAYQDIASDGSSYAKQYFQKSGTLKISNVDSDGNISGTLEATLIEVTIGSKEEGYPSNPVAGGACIEIESGTFGEGEEEACVPDCTGKICGSDGCGGVCGNCNTGLACSENQNECVELEISECTGLSLEWDSLYRPDYINEFYALSEEEDGPMARMEFWQNEQTGAITAGTYDLGSAKNLEYATCTECVFAYSDVEDGYYTKTYFQHEGTITISSVGDNNEITGTISATLVEANIAKDANDKIITTFLATGNCMEIETAAFDTLTE